MENHRSCKNPEDVSIGAADIESCGSAALPGKAYITGSFTTLPVK
jgi:hypothetical protein